MTKRMRVISLEIMMAAVRKLPLVVILGATGTGKSKLAIELAQRFNGEIISADSMQVYRELDIITNKVTAEEQRCCKHHLIGYIDPLTPNNSVVDFRDKALPIIDKLFEEDKMPVIVGGTNYYIEALLWNFLINSKDINEAKKEEQLTSVSKDSTEDETHRCVEHGDKNTGTDDNDTQLREVSSKNNDTLVHEPAVPRSSENHDNSVVEVNTKLREGKFAQFETGDLYQRLMQVDPDRGRTLHPRNRRRIIRALEVYEEHGVPISDILRVQHVDSTGPALSGPLRYPHTCILWIQSEHKALCERLDSRVDSMVERGLLHELNSFHQHYVQMTTHGHRKPDYTLGIFQSIGFKEFHNYLMLTDKEKESEKGRLLKEEGITELKLVTRRYAKRQIKWIKNRFLKRPGDNVPVVYSLESTDVTRWQEDVFNPAEEILSAVIEGRQPKIAPTEFSRELSDEPVYNVCDVCGGRVFVTKNQWESHVGSRRHKKLFGKQLKREREGQQESGLEKKLCV